ncbi:MAG: hypothetical protein LBF72_03280 [Holosporales bacterium]|nr:hypothetical protein [Holosporales bacterium]
MSNVRNLGELTIQPLALAKRTLVGSKVEGVVFSSHIRSGSSAFVAVAAWWGFVLNCNVLCSIIE